MIFSDDLTRFLLNVSQLKKMSNNAKPTAESSTPAETVEDGIKPTSENGIEKGEEVGKKVKQNVSKKESNVVKKGVKE